MNVQNFKGGVRAKGFIIFGERKNMSWTTIYITGKSDFREEVKKKLEHSDQRYMPGFIEDSSDEFTHDLYWLDGRTDLRTFKEAIGGKIIWKHRLRFYKTLWFSISSLHLSNHLQLAAAEFITRSHLL